MLVIEKEDRGNKSISADLEIANLITGSTLSFIQAKNYYNPSHFVNVMLPFEIADKVNNIYNLHIFSSKDIDKIVPQNVEIPLHVVEKYTVISYLSYTSNTKNSNYSKPLTLTKRINHFSSLPSNWDSYGADKVSQKAIEVALHVVARLIVSRIFLTNYEINVFPMRDGGIQFEFDNNYSSYELEISPEGNLNFIQYDNNNEIVLDIPNFNLFDLKDHLLKFSNVRAVQNY